MTRRITKNSRSVYKDFSSGTVQPAKQQPGMPAIPKNDVRNQPGTRNFSYPNTGAYREINGAPNQMVGSKPGQTGTESLKTKPLNGQSNGNFMPMGATNSGGSVAQAANKIVANAQPRVTPNTQPNRPAAAAAPVVTDVSGNAPATTTTKKPPETTTPTTPDPNKKGKDGYTNADRTKYFNINPKSLTRGTKEHNEYWNWYNSTVVNGEQTDKGKRTQYLRWAYQAPNWWEQGKRREGAELDYKQRSEQGLLPEQVQAKDPAYQAWQASMAEDQRKNAWYAVGLDPADADKLYGRDAATGQSYWPDPSVNYKDYYNPPVTTTTTTTNVDTTDYNNYPYDANGNYIFSDRATGNDINVLNGQTFKRMNKRQSSMKSIRKEEAPPAWWTQTRNRRYDAQAQQAADAKAAADAAAKNAWQASMEEDNRKNAWWALGIDPATQPPGAIAGQNPFDANNNFLFSDRATGNDINADSAPKPRTKKPASKPASKPKTVTPYKLNSTYTMDDQGMATADFRVPKPVTQMGPKGPYTIGYTDSAPQYNEARPLGYKGPAKAYSGMPVATTLNGVPIGPMTDGMIIPKGSNWPTYSGQVDTPNTGTLKRMTKRTKKEPICENCGMPVSQCKCAGHSHKSSKKMTKGINLRALSTSLGRLMRDSKPVVRAMRRAESPIGLRRGLKDLATNVAFEVSPTGRRSARNLAAAERTMAKNPMANPYMQDFSIGDKKYHMGFDARSMKNAITRQLKKTPQLLPPILLGYGLTNGQSTTKRIRKSMSPNLGGFIESTEYRMTATPGKKPKISVSHTDTPIISKRATGPKPNKYFQ